MLFLFNKVYITLDTMFERGEHSIIISPKASLTTIYPELAEIDELDFGTVHFAATTYQNLLNSNFDGDDIKFLDWLFNFNPTSRLTIYCDATTFADLAFKWYKTLLINMDEDEAVVLMTLFFKRYAYQFGYPYTPSIRLTKQQAMANHDFGSHWFDPVRVREKWRQTSPIISPLFATISAFTAVEFQLATYLTNKNWEFKSILEQKTINMLRKHVVEVLCDLKQETLSRLVQLPNFNILTTSLSEYITKHPEFSFLLDDKFVPDQYQYVYASYDMEKLLKVFRDRVVQLYGHIDDALIEELKTKYLNTTLDDIIALELSRPFGTVYLAQGQYKVTVNNYILTHILQLYREQDLTRLSKYALE